MSSEVRTKISVLDTLELLNPESRVILRSPSTPNLLEHECGFPDLLLAQSRTRVSTLVSIFSSTK